MSRRKLSDEEKGAKVEARRTVRQAVTDRKQNIQDWFTKKAEASEKAAKEARKERNSQPRGVDRVPERLRNLGGHSYTPIAEYNDDNRASRRAMALMDRERPERVPRETIFHKRDNKGELTNEKVEVKPSKGPAAKPYMRRGSNVPYVNPRRIQKRRRG